MSFMKKLNVEAMATHPGFLKVQMINNDGTVACETLMNMSMANGVIKQIEDSTAIAKKLQDNMQSIIVKEALNGTFGPNMQAWAENGDYNNAR